MKNYWTCSKFADWLRGVPKPGSATFEDWRDWEKSAKKKHPVRYWLADDGLDFLDKTVHWIPEKINDVRYYVNNRWIDRTHYMRTGLEPGKWYDYETRMLNGLFEELVDFVEIENAWHHVVWNEDAQKKFKSPWWRKWYRLWRSPEAGIEQLEWAASLTVDETWGLNPGDKGYGEPTAQALAAKETLRLYNWWKHVRPARPDIYDVTGWSEYCKSRGDNIFNLANESKAERKKSSRMLNSIRKLEDQYDSEDTEMLIALVKIRKYLWT